MAKPWRPAASVVERRAPRARRHPPGEQQGLEPERREPAREVLRVLLGEQFRRRHQRGLEAGLDDVGGRERGDDRLAGADVALHEAHHRVRHREVGPHFPEDALLRGGQRIAGSGQQGPGERAVRANGNGRVTADRRAKLPERELLREQLLEGEAPLRRVAAGREHVEPRIRRRAMHVRQRLVQARKPELAHDLPRQEVRQFAVAHRGERLRREVTQAPLLDALGHGIDRRQDVLGRLRVGRGRVLVLGVHDLGPVLAAAHFAEALQARAAHQLLLLRAR